MAHYLFLQNSDRESGQFYVFQPNFFFKNFHTSINPYVCLITFSVEKKKDLSFLIMSLTVKKINFITIQEYDTNFISE